MSRVQSSAVLPNPVLNNVGGVAEGIDSQTRSAERTDWTALRLPQLPSRFVSTSQEAELPESLQIYSERLNSNDFQEREAGMREIAANPALQADLEAVVFSEISNTLPLEVSYRLNAALQLSWQNKPAFQQLEEIRSLRTTQNLQSIYVPGEEVLAGIHTRDSDRYLRGIQQLERYSALTEAYLSARHGLWESYPDIDVAMVFDIHARHPLGDAICRLDQILSNPEAAQPELFANVEKIHNLVLQNHNLVPGDIANLDIEQYYAVCRELQLLNSANFRCAAIESIDPSALRNCDGCREKIIEPFK